MELNIPEGFFDGEIRDGFYIDRMMKRNWASMIKILAEIDRICSKYDIKYFADWGTLLGAARHKGFVPWDDDIDIGMLRPDYERFNAVAPGELPAGWEILNMHNDKAWLQPLEHLITGRAVRRSKEELEEFYGFPYVAGIDIFPYDYSAPTKEEDEYVRDMERVLLNVAQCYKNDEYTAEAKEALLVQVEQLCRVHVDRSGDVPNQLYKLFEKLVTMYGEDETPYIAYLPKHANIKKECYSETILMDFEYIKVPMPIGYEEILGYKYGKEWRTPRLVRSSHDYPYYQKQHEFDLKQRGLI